MEKYFRQYDTCRQNERPFCSVACPFHADVLDFQSKMAKNNYNAAFRTFRNAAGFPDIAAALCPEYCASACPRGEMDQSVQLNILEKTCVAKATKKDPTDYNVPLKNRRVAVIGAGISGLACALRLTQKKYDVTIYEKTGRLGGRLWDMLPPEVFLEDIRRQFQFEKYALHLNTEIKSLDEIRDQGFEAVYAATGKGGLDFGAMNHENGHCFMDGGIAVFAGGGLAGKDPVRALADGLDMAWAVEVFLKTGRLEYPEGEKPCRAVADPDKLLHTDGVIPTDNGLFSNEEAAAEAGRCIRCQCDACMKYCDVCAFHNKWPMRIRDDVMATVAFSTSESMLKKTPAKRLMNTCTQCGLCDEVCPESIEIGAMLLEARRSLRRQGTMPGAYHQFWIKDMEFTNGEFAALSRRAPGQETGPAQKQETGPQQKQETGPQQEQETGPQQKQETGPQQKQETGPQQKQEPGPAQKQETGPQQKQETGPQQKQETGPQQKQETGPQQGPARAYAFFPGCQLGAADPRYVAEPYRWLLSKKPDTGLLLRCCGVPAEWAGNEAMHKNAIADLRGDWERLGRPALIYACPACRKHLKEYLPEIETVSLYEILNRWGFEAEAAPDGVSVRHGVVPENGVVSEDGMSPEAGAGNRNPAGKDKIFSIFDPCTARQVEPLKRSVRKIAGLAGVTAEELPKGDKHGCCGYGGHVSEANADYAAWVAKNRGGLSENPYIVYCVNCRDIFKGEGKPALHILDLLFDINGTDTGLPDLSERRRNRVVLKETLLKEIWGEKMEHIPEPCGFQLIIGTEIREKMNRLKVLEEDIREVLKLAETAKRRTFDPKKGTFACYRELGHITYWVEYRPVGEEYEIVNVYTHRMKIKLEGVWNGRKTAIDL